MTISFEQAIESLQTAIVTLFGADPGVRSVGIARRGSDFGYDVVRNSHVPLSPRTVQEINGIHVWYDDASGEIEPQVIVPTPGRFSPSAGNPIEEVCLQRPLVCGVQIQNFDHDRRRGLIKRKEMSVGTLGCFVRLANGRMGLLTNNHVIAGENSGYPAKDRIAQPGADRLYDDHKIGRLSHFDPLQPSAKGASVHTAAILFNEIDAAAATIDDGIDCAQEFHPSHGLMPLKGIAAAQLSDRVFKIGRTTGLTYGEVAAIAVTVGPVKYGIGNCWFRNSIRIRGLNGQNFSKKGDSGSIVVNESGEAIGMLYSGIGMQSYVCPIDAVLRDLNVTLA